MKSKDKVWHISAINVSEVIVGLQILYSLFKIFSVLLLITISIKIIISPIILELEIGIISIFIGINYFRVRVYGWYGTASLYVIILLKNVGIIITIIVYLFFKQYIENLFPQSHEPKITIQSLLVVLEVIVSIFMIKFLFRSDLINQFNLDVKRKFILLIKVIIISLISIIVYFGLALVL